MALEIERKFLLHHLPDLADESGARIVQGYLRADERASVRVRITDGQARLTVKGAQHGITRTEFEYDIPTEDARVLLDDLIVGDRIEKRRFQVPFDGRTWELDVFEGVNAGLVVAEIELDSEQDEPTLPAWVGREVSDDPRFLNASLCRRPFSRWSAQDRAEFSMTGP